MGIIKFLARWYYKNVRNLIPPDWCLSDKHPFADILSNQAQRENDYIYEQLKKIK